MVEFHSREMIRGMVALGMGYLNIRPKEADGSMDNPNIRNAIYFQFDIRMSHWNKTLQEEDGSERLCAHIIAMPRHSMFFMETPWAPATCPSYSDFNWQGFTNISNHDSCWSDSIERELNKLERKCWEEVKRQSGVEFHWNEKDCRKHNLLQRIQHVEIEVERKKVDRYMDTRWVINNGKLIKDLTHF